VVSDGREEEEEEEEVIRWCSREVTFDERS
jgi:hypothetical protein